MGIEFPDSCKDW
jgi:DNA topoisomerase-3